MIQQQKTPPVLTNARIFLWHETHFCTNWLRVEIRHCLVQVPCRPISRKPLQKWWYIFLLRETALIIYLIIPLWGKLNVRIYLEETVLLLHIVPKGWQFGWPVPQTNCQHRCLNCPASHKFLLRKVRILPTVLASNRGRKIWSVYINPLFDKIPWLCEKSLG